MRRNRLPTPYTDASILLETLCFGTPGIHASSTWPSANRAIHVPIVLPCDATCVSLSVLGTNTTGNYDLGLYDDNNNLIASKGSTAMAAAALTLTLSSLRMRGGRTYWMALALSSTSGTVYRWTTGSVARLTGLSVTQEASALALPSTRTPSDPATDFVPLFTLGLL